MAVKTESIDFDGSFPTFSPWTRVPLVAVKTEVVDLDERSPTFSPLLAIGGESFIVCRPLSLRIFSFPVQISILDS